MDRSITMYTNKKPRASDGCVKKVSLKQRGMYECMRSELAVERDRETAPGGFGIINKSMKASQPRTVVPCSCGQTQKMQASGPWKRERRVTIAGP
jgi:hypothetical protein